MEIYNDLKHAIIFHKEDSNYLIYKWYDLAISLEEMKMFQKVNLKFIEENGVNDLIADIRTAKNKMLPDTLDYYTTYVEPKFVDLGVKRIVTVSNNDSLINVNNKKWQDSTKSIDLYEVGFLNEADELIKEFGETVSSF